MMTYSDNYLYIRVFNNLIQGNDAGNRTYNAHSRFDS